MTTAMFFSTLAKANAEEQEQKDADDDEYVSQYKEDGYILVPGLLSTAEVSDIRAEMFDICRGKYGAIDGVDHGRDGPALSEDELLSKYLCIHFPHKICDKVLALAARHRRTIAILQAIVSPNVKLLQTMMFLKGAQQPGQHWHQDEYYIPTRDRSLTGVWVAVEDTDVENGCLWVIPGSHKLGFILPTEPHHDEANFDPTPKAIIEHLNLFTDVDVHTDTDTDTDADTDANAAVMNANARTPTTKAGDAISVPMKAGDGLFFNGYLLHRSLKNVSTGSRLSFANHYMSAESMLPWNYDDRLEGHIRDARDIVLVAGTDPYAYKGTEDLEATKPFVRGLIGGNQLF